jgi:hypothetical protein
VGLSGSPGRPAGNHGECGDFRANPSLSANIFTAGI